MKNHSINNNVFTKTECENIIDFCIKNGQQYSYTPSEMTSWDCKKIHDEEFKTNILNKLNNNYKNGEYGLWVDYDKFNFKNFNISLTSYYNGRYLNLHKDYFSELTSVVVLSEGYEGGEFALSDSSNPDIKFKIMKGIETYDLKMGDMISFNGSKTYHGVLPVANGIRYALNIWMTESEYTFPIHKINKTIL
jgi:hypothetical protein